MWEAIHAAFGFDVDASIIGGFVSELAFVADFIRDITSLYSNELGMMQRCHEVEVGNVHCHKLRTLCGDDTIE